MTITHLIKLACETVLPNNEKEGIQRSIGTLQTRLIKYFRDQLSCQFIFGSYSRGTILPRSMDPQSDVDYMVIFSDSGLQPQSYLDRLRRFAEHYYSRSEISQSHPTIVLELNHIQFELVPAIWNYYEDSLQIPTKFSNYQSWQNTNPNDFNDKLKIVNQTHNNNIKPLVRIMKYWNAKSGYPFESYTLEQQIVSHRYCFLGLVMQRQISDYFFQIVDALDAGASAPQWKRDAMAHMKQSITQARILYHAGQIDLANAIIAKLLPL